MSKLRPTCEKISDEVHPIWKEDLGKGQSIQVAQVSDPPGCNQDGGVFQGFIVDDGKRRDTSSSDQKANPISFLNRDTLLVQ